MKKKKIQEGKCDQCGSNSLNYASIQDNGQLFYGLKCNDCGCVEQSWYKRKGLETVKRDLNGNRI